ncbi:lactonase family protein [Candidatus Burkholderia verschuerenii]|uniref:lactonase family protein n=1 Tax=Candidatus Burkholderia verschuerenii TaxID=242163 RepID=UPI001E447713|nr:lactonase family protein [Candidatus Burkholderia verschuerenii]
MTQTYSVFVSNAADVEIGAFRFDAAGGKLEAESRIPADTNVMPLTWSPDGRTLYAATRGARRAGEHRHVCIRRRERCVDASRGRADRIESGVSVRRCKRPLSDRRVVRRASRESRVFTMPRASRRARAAHCNSSMASRTRIARCRRPMDASPT